MDNRCFQSFGDGEQIYMSAGTTGTAKYCDLLRAIEHLGGFVQFGIGRALDGYGIQNSKGKWRGGTFAQEDVAGNDDHGDAAFRQSGAHGDAEYSRHLARLGNEFAEMAAVLEEMFGVR